MEIQLRLSEKLQFPKFSIFCRCRGATYDASDTVWADCCRRLVFPYMVDMLGGLGMQMWAWGWTSAAVAESR